MSKAILCDSALLIGCKACEGDCAERWGLPYHDMGPSALYASVATALFGFIAKEGRAADLVAMG